MGWKLGWQMSPVTKVDIGAGTTDSCKWSRVRGDDSENRRARYARSVTHRHGHSGREARKAQVAVRASGGPWAFDAHFGKQGTLPASDSVEIGFIVGDDNAPPR